MAFRRERYVSATSAIKRSFAVQIITDASDIRLFFFRDRRILDCALISAVRLIRDDAFSGISERFITKKVPLPVGWTADVTLAVFLLPCPLVCRNVFVRPAASPGERISGEGGENKARVRGALTKREGKTGFRAIECIEHMHAAVDRKSKKKKRTRYYGR